MSSAGIGALLDREDREALADMVRGFVRAEIAPLVQHPEDPVGPDVVEDLLSRLATLGVLTGDGEPGPGVWDLPAESTSCELSTEVLGRVAEVSPGVAYALHLRALGGWLDRAASAAGTASVASFDRIGAGGGRATGRALAGNPLAEDVSELETAWGAASSECPQLVVGSAAWSHLWAPRWSTGDGWRLTRTSRTELACTPLSHAHGLDELSYQLCHGGTGDAVLDPEYVVDAFAVHGLGVLAIAAATVRRAVSRAREYSATRRQGGRLIGAHDAIAQLLGRAQQSLATADAVLVRLADLPAGPERLHQVWRARAGLYPLLTAAGSDALQVFGGVGYMRDVGAEKDLRDLNTLRRLGGSPLELTLRCAAFDESPAVYS